MYKFWSKYHLSIGNSNLLKNHSETSYLLNKLNVLFEMPVYDTIAVQTTTEWLPVPSCCNDPPPVMPPAPETTKLWMPTELQSQIQCLKRFSKEGLCCL